MRRAGALVLPLAVLATAAAGLVYAAVQYDLRSGANDPQVQLAEDAAARLDAGGAPSAQLGSRVVDIAASLAPFIVVYDASDGVLASDGRLDGSPPRPPSGVLDVARRTGRDIVTWQPREGVRIAVVVVPWRGGTVLAGRSLRLVEQREDELLLLFGLAWLSTLLALAVAGTVAARLWPPHDSRPDSMADGV